MPRAPSRLVDRGAQMHLQVRDGQPVHAELLFPHPVHDGPVTGARPRVRGVRRHVPVEHEHVVGLGRRRDGLAPIPTIEGEQERHRPRRLGDVPQPAVQRIVRAFTDEAGVPGAWLEWHGHNDFHKVLVNGVTAWLYGCGGVNGTLMGFGERTGNAPLEALVIDYISLTGNDEAADPTVITEIAQYFEKELDYRIPDNYPFAGKDFNATSAGIHVDGLAKNEEIYNIFDTTKILNRSVPIIINDKAGRAGVADGQGEFGVDGDLLREGDAELPAGLAEAGDADFDTRGALRGDPLDPQ